MRSHESFKARSAFAEFQRLRDEIRVRLHLATQEARSQWDALETKLVELENDISGRGEVTLHGAAEVLKESARAFISALNRQGDPTRRTVAEIMTANPVACSANDSLAEAARIMWEFDCGAVPVVDEQRHLVGIITDRDICMAAYLQRRAIHELNVGSAMARSVQSCLVDDSVSDLEVRLAALQVRRMPVIDATGRLIGMVSLGDVARAFAPAENGLGSRGLARTLAAISEPRPQRKERPAEAPERSQNASGSHLN